MYVTLPLHKIETSSRAQKDTWQNVTQRMGWSGWHSSSTQLEELGDIGELSLADELGMLFYNFTEPGPWWHDLKTSNMPTM